MAGLKQTVDASEQLQELASQLQQEVADGQADFGELARLADDIAESADALAAAFFAIDEALTPRSPQPRREGAERKGSRGRGGARAAKGGEQRSETADAADEPTKAEAREREQPLEELSAEELHERARALEIAGRSTMTKEELVEAVRAEESLSKEELLDRAREADIPGRSAMSKEELREALRSH